MAKVVKIKDRRKQGKKSDPKKIRTIAPLLANGEVRVKDYGRLPEAVKEGLRAIAAHENKSMSWVKEQIIIDWCGLPKPEYKDLKEKEKERRRAR